MTPPRSRARMTPAEAECARLAIVIFGEWGVAERDPVHGGMVARCTHGPPEGSPRAPLRRYSWSSLETALRGVLEDSARDFARAKSEGRA